MGIKIDTQWRGIHLPNCYIRILHVSGGKKQGWVGVAEIFADRPSAVAGEPCLETVSVYDGPGMGPPMEPPVDWTWNPLPYDALYLKLKEKYPVYVDAQELP